MTEDQRRRGPAATQVEATGQAVRDNVARLRKARGLSTHQLAQQLAESGRPIPQSGISRIESGARRVDVDDLVALAIALKVSPSALLLPLDDAPEKTIEVTGAGPVPADAAWDWMDGRRPLHTRTAGLDHTEALEYDLYSRPPRRRRSWEALQELIVSAESSTADVVEGLRREDPEGGGDG
ncbi:helix-turn-helix domain-containing protein [Streptomyces phaeochromogenes]